MSQRTYHDPLHRGIGLDRQAPAEGMVMDLVDCLLYTSDAADEV